VWKETKNMTARALTHGQKVFLFSAGCYEDRKKMMKIQLPSQWYDDILQEKKKKEKS